MLRAMILRIYIYLLNKVKRFHPNEEIYIWYMISLYRYISSFGWNLFTLFSKRRDRVKTKFDHFHVNHIRDAYKGNCTIERMKEVDREMIWKKSVNYVIKIKGTRDFSTLAYTYTYCTMFSKEYTTDKLWLTEACTRIRSLNTFHH